MLEYDDVMNKQRELIYGQRGDILKGDNMRQTLIGMVHNMIDSTAERNFTGDGSFDWSVDEASEYLEHLCLKPGTFEGHAQQIRAMSDPDELVKLLYADAEAFYAEREELLSALGIDMREFERVVMLNAIDRHWMDHIDAMDDLRDGIGLRAYGQRNPVQEYRLESYDMFNDMVHMIREDTVRRLFQARVETPARTAENRGCVQNPGGVCRRGREGQPERSGQKGRSAHQHQHPWRGRPQPALPLRQR